MCVCVCVNFDYVVPYFYEKSSHLATLTDTMT